MEKMLLYVFVGSGLGGVCRYLVSSFTLRFVSGRFPQCSWEALFPWGTLLVNICGCFIIGVLYALVNKLPGVLSPEMQTLLMAGFCGGLTTFSTFSHENYLLFQSNNFCLVAVYAALSLLFGFMAAWLGHLVIMR